MPEPAGLLIYGAAGFGRELAAWAELAEGFDGGVRVLGFIDDHSGEREINDRSVWRLEDAARRHADAFVVGAVGQPGLRETLVDRARSVGLRPAPPLVHPSVWYDRDRVSIGEGSVICGGTTLTTNIRLGRHVQINLHCTIAHDVEVGDFVTVSPGCHISGRVRIGRAAFLGTGAVTVQGEAGAPLVIGEGAVVGAAAAVIKSVEPDSMVFGVPARPLLRPPSAG